MLLSNLDFLHDEPAESKSTRRLSGACEVMAINQRMLINKLSTLASKLPKRHIHAGRSVLSAAPAMAPMGGSCQDACKVKLVKGVGCEATFNQLGHDIGLEAEKGENTVGAARALMAHQRRPYVVRSCSAMRHTHPKPGMTVRSEIA
jgi:hypothetical protein